MSSEHTSSSDGAGISERSSGEHTGASESQGRTDYRILAAGITKKGAVVVGETLVTGVLDRTNDILSMAGISLLDIAVGSKGDITTASTGDMRYFREHIPFLPGSIERGLGKTPHPGMTELLLNILDKTGSIEQTTEAAGRLVQAHIHDKAERVYSQLHDEFFPRPPQSPGPYKMSKEEELEILTKELAAAPGRFTQKLVQEKIDRLINPDKYSVAR